MYSGSIFRKWDLHVHTPASFEQQYRFEADENEQYGNDIWEKYISKLEEITDICALGITDYFTVDGYNKVLEYKNKGRLKNITLILPNIEFRLDKFIGLENKSVNFHVIFSDKIDVENIEKHFLEDLKFDFSAREKRRITRANIIEFGKSVKETQKALKGDDDWLVGCKHLVVSEEEIATALDKRIFDGNYILVLADSEISLLDWDGRDHQTRKNFLTKAHCIFSSNSKTRAWALGLKDLNVKDFTEIFGSLKPCIHGSDGHCFEKLCKPDANRFCWIKSDATFEGLKQIMYEPTDRVIIQDENPQERKNIYSIASIKIKECKVNDELTISESEIGINNNLVTIIGGKGSGKTAILDLTANCFEERCYRHGKGAPEEKNSFVQRIESDTQELEIEVNFVGTMDNFNKKITDDKLFKSGKITYLPQGQIEDYSSDRKKLNEKIKQVIFDNKQVKDGQFKNNFEKIDNEVRHINQKIESTNLSIFTLERETTDEIIKGLTSELANAEGQLKNQNSELEAVRKNIKEGEQGKAQELRNNENSLQDKKRTIEAFEFEREALKLEFQYSLPSVNEKITVLNTHLVAFKIENIIPSVDYKSQLEALEKASTDLQQISAGILEEIKSVEDALAKLEGIEKAEAVILKAIEYAQQNINSITAKIADVNAKKTKIQEFENERLASFIELMVKFLEWRSFYRSVIETFAKESSKILSGVGFESSVHFDYNNFFRDGSELLNMTKVSEDELNKLSDLLKGITKKESGEQIKVEVANFICEVMTHKNQLKARKTRLDFYNWVFKNYYSLDTNVLFNGIHMDRLSIGQKGTVLLKIFLAEGDYPLIVDMPEENLDNKFIYDELKDAIRQAKKKRQIILATNNANLVINTDAEEVIVADYKDNVIKYKVGSIEDKSIRDEITHILEGGREALIKREQKYGF